jgi:Alanine dehydrogenase/PNT, N-terminal domain
LVKQLTNDVVLLAVCKSLSGDNRVPLTPANLSRLKSASWNNGKEHTQLHILVEEGAGEQSGYDDQSYRDAGAEIAGLSDILREAHILLDVKQRPPAFILRDGVNIFYAHIEKGQAPDYLRALSAIPSMSLYSPETIFVPTREGGMRRGVNLGFYAGVGAVHLAFEGLRISRERRSLRKGPFASFPVVSQSTLDDINDAYLKFTEQERSTKVAIIGSERGLVASGAMAEFERAHLQPKLLDRQITGSPKRLAEALARVDAIVNASQWFPGEPRIITRQQIATMREGAVFIDATCDNDLTSYGELESRPGEAVAGGVRFSFESKWTDPHLFYWAGLDRHTAKQPHPALRTSDDLRVLYSANGRIPGGRSTARKASDVYSEMIFPYLVNIIRAVSMDAELPRPGLVLRRGVVVHEGLRNIIATNENLADLQPYCTG